MVDTCDKMFNIIEISLDCCLRGEENTLIGTLIETCPCITLEKGSVLVIIPCGGVGWVKTEEDGRGFNNIPEGFLHNQPNNFQD